MYNNLLIAIDLNDLKGAKYVVETALKLTANNPDAVYRVVSIVEPVDNSLIAAFLPKNFDQSVLAETNKALHQFTQQYFPLEAKVQHNVVYGTVYEEICQIAQQKNVDIIIMLASSKDDPKYLSNNTSRIVHHTDKPMLILR